MEDFSNEACTYRDVPSRLLLGILDHSVINDHRVSRRSIWRDSHIPSNALAELRVGIIQEQNFILDAIDLAPRAHDPRVICRDHSDNIDTFVLDAGNVLDISRQMAH